MSKSTAVVVGVGAERGLGAALCRRFAQGGHHVLVAGRTAAKINKVAEAIVSSGGSAEPIVTDATLEHDPVTSLQHPDWTPVFDYDPAQAIESRKAILDRAATDRVMVMGYHFPFPAIGHVVRRDTAYHWEAAQWAW